MKWIDSHCHIDFKNFNKDREHVLKRVEKELLFAINVAASFESNPTILEMAAKYPYIYGVLGLHPHDCEDFEEGFLGFLKKHIHHPKIVAVGEIGLDYYKNYSPKNIQLKVFEKLAAFTVEEKKPMVIHSREAIDDTLKILDTLKAKDVLFHCFTGSLEEAEKVLERDYYISLSGVITFSKNMKKVVKALPMDKVMVETDSPFLTPNPHRGKRNEPVYVKHIGEKLAEIKGLDVEEVKIQTCKNVKKFFRIS